MRSCLAKISAKTDPCGMTLLEMMVVLALLAGLAAMTVPNSLHRYRLKHAAQRLVADMLYARMRAVATTRQYRIVLAPETNAYWIEVGNRSRDSTDWRLEASPRRFAVPGNEAYFPGVRLVSATSGAITFKPTGGQTFMTISLQHESGMRMNIRTAIAGRIRMELVK